MCLFRVDDPVFALAFYRGPGKERAPLAGARPSPDEAGDGETTLLPPSTGARTASKDPRWPERSIETEPAA